MKILIGCVNLKTRPLTEIWIETLNKSIEFAKKNGIDTDSDIKVVIVCNTNEDNIKEIQPLYPNITWINEDKVSAVSYNWNLIIKEGFDDKANALYDYYIPANNDIYFTERWLLDFIECLKQNDSKEFGWISSMMNDYKEPDLTGVVETVHLENRYWGGIRPEAPDVDNKEQMYNVLKIAYAPFGGIEEFSKNLKAKYGVKLKAMHPKAPLFALSKECIKQVGMFDEFAAPDGVHEDADYCERITRYSPFKFGAAFGPYVHHYSMMTRTKDEFKTDWVPRREDNWVAKWGVGSKDIGNQETVKGMKLDIGCGAMPRKEPGWYHMDIDKRWKDVEFLHDIYEGLPFEDNSLEEIYCSNNLEHIEWRKTYSVLFDWYSKLKVGGKIEIRVPNFKFLAEQYVRGAWNIRLQEGVELSAQHAIMGGEYPGYGHLHKALFDFGNLSEAMKDVGFQDIRDTSNQGSWELRITAVK